MRRAADGTGTREPLAVDPGHTDRLARYFAFVWNVLETLRREAREPSEIHLWPEHFDIAFEDQEVTYGGSPGDENHEEPYLYVAPWTKPQDEALLAWLDGLPTGKRQPNLLFASYRLVAGTPAGWEEFRSVLGERRAEVEAVMLERRTQTNEPARCAALLPLLAALPQPLALLEVGASAGLCLLPDRYAYDYAGHRVDACETRPHGAAAEARRERDATPGAGVTPPPLLRCRPDGDVPLPTSPPEVVWRAGLDLNPLDIGDPAQARWLELLVWPGQEHRLDVLRGALAVARADPPRVLEGDLTTDLPALAAEAPRDATLVIFHTAVLGYVPSEGRKAFRDALTGTWIACKGPHLLGFEPGPPGLFALAQDGRRLAWADPHGAALSWG